MGYQGTKLPPLYFEEINKELSHKENFFGEPIFKISGNTIATLIVMETTKRSLEAA